MDDSFLEEERSLAERLYQWRDDPMVRTAEAEAEMMARLDQVTPKELVRGGVFRAARMVDADAPGSPFLRRMLERIREEPVMKSAAEELLKAVVSSLRPGDARGYDVAEALIRAGDMDLSLVPVLLQARSVETVDWLLSRGADPNLPGRHLYPLHAFVEHDEILERLVAAGAEVDVQDVEGNTPLLLALLLRHANNDPDEGAVERAGRNAVLDRVVAILLSAGARTDLENHLGISPDSLGVLSGEAASHPIRGGGRTRRTRRRSHRRPSHRRRSHRRRIRRTRP